MFPVSLDQELRHHVYTALARGGRAPGASSLAATLGLALAEVRDGLERLHCAHALVLDAVTREVRMALPFSNVPTAYRLESGGRFWDANCAWDSLALVRLLGLQQARVVDHGGRGREGSLLSVVDGDLVERDGVISSPRPAWQWWDDIVFTRSRILLFRSEEAARSWMSSAGKALATSMTLDQCWHISETWYSGRLDLGYQRPPLDHFQRVLGRAGLIGDAWSLSPPRAA